MIVFVCFVNCIEKFVCAEAELVNRLRNYCFHFWVFTFGPIILVPNISPTDLIIEKIALFVLIYIFFLLRYF